MRIGIILFIFLLAFSAPCYAMDYTAPSAPRDVQELVPYEPETFAQGLWEVMKGGIGLALPDVKTAAGVCLSVFAVFFLVGILKGVGQQTGSLPEWAAAAIIATILFSQTKTMIDLGVDTVRQLSEYGKLLLPVMTAALAAQGGVTASGGLYLGTAVFDTVLISAASSFIVPLSFLYLALAVGHSMTGEEMLEKVKAFLKGLITWVLKLSLYVFSAYMTLTGVVSGAADQTVVKATRLTIAGMVPVIGGILSEASETVVVGAGVMKNAAGVYGLLVILAIWITPFLRIGIQYGILKAAAGLCSGFGVKRASILVNDFSDVMGFLLAMTATECVFLFITVVCFMKGMG